jgi:hypothetical protein
LPLWLVQALEREVGLTREQVAELNEDEANRLLVLAELDEDEANRLLVEARSKPRE